MDIHLELKNQEGTIESYTFNSEAENRLFQILQRMFPSAQRIVSQNVFFDMNTGNQMKMEDILLKVSKRTLELLNGFPKTIEQMQIKELFSILSQSNAHLIKEQRLLKLDTFERNNTPDAIKRSFSYTIQNYASELKILIQQKQAEAFQEAQKLDNTFPTRLLQNSNALSPEEFNKRSKGLSEKQQQLQHFGITVSNIQKVPEYNEGKADVLSVYLDDSETKTFFLLILLQK